MPRQEQGIEYYLIDNGEKRFRVRWRENGKQKSRSFARVTGPAGARAFYSQVREAHHGGRLARVSSAKLSLAQFVQDVWAPRARRRLEAKTWDRDKTIYNTHILKQIGENPIAEIDGEILVLWQDELEQNGAGAATVIRAMSILSNIFREATRRSRSTGVTGNPVALLDRPSAKRRRRPLVWGPLVVERVRYEVLVGSVRINPDKRLMAMRDSALVGFMAMTGCRPGEALALRWCDVEDKVVITKRLSGDVIIDRTKNGTDRTAPLLDPLREDLQALREASGDGPLDRIFHRPDGHHYVQTDWRNYRSRHFVPALERVEAGWTVWREGLDDPGSARESVEGLSGTRPYDLGRHSHSALMLASGMGLQRLARIHGHSLRVLDETYSEQLEEFEDRARVIDPIAELSSARALAWVGRDPSTGDELPSGSRVRVGQALRGTGRPGPLSSLREGRSGLGRLSRRDRESGRPAARRGFRPGRSGRCDRVDGRRGA